MTLSRITSGDTEDRIRTMIGTITNEAISIAIDEKQHMGKDRIQESELREYYGCILDQMVIGVMNAKVQVWIAIHKETEIQKSQDKMNAN